ncbi:MAG: M20/M25/M40 family metallo-hydrolase, partial [Bacillota bacterium]|nr:M20/M25/M40 family metallo-hydrolase [Bacillota bacterium]
ERLEAGKELTFRRMYVDLGAASQKEAQSLVRVGEMAALSQRVELAGGRLVGKALDDRAGCAVLVRVLQELRHCPHDLYCVFTVQEEVGRRGAWTAAYQVEPDLAVVVDVTPAGDTPEPEQRGVALGKGPAVKVMDRSVISHPQVRRLLAETAERHGIPFQWEVLERGGTDAGSIHVSRSGVPTGALSLPARYLHTPNEMVDLEDLRCAALLLVRFLEEPLEERFLR